MTTTPDIEERLRAALAARAEQVRPEALTPAPLVLSPRSKAPWILLASAATVLLVLVLAFRGQGNPRSDDMAPEPKDPEVVLPSDVGRDWSAAKAATPARVDLDGDGTQEKVTYRAEPSDDFVGRIRLETTLTSTGEDVFGVADLGTTIGIDPLDPFDADGDGDQELVLLHELDPNVVGGLYAPMIFDLRDGLLVQAPAEDPDLLKRGDVTVPGSERQFYDRAVIHQFWFEDGTLYSAQSINDYARGNMTFIRPENVVMDAWVWRLDDRGILRAEEAGCRLDTLDGVGPCGDQTSDDPLVVDGPATEHWDVGEGGTIEQGLRFDVRLEPGDPPTVVAVAEWGQTLRHEVDVPDPQLVAFAQPFGISFDGMSVAVTSASDPDALALLVQDGDGFVELRAVGEVPFGNGTHDDGRPYRSWMTDQGAVITAVATDEEQIWEIWTWQTLRGNRMTALPRGTACIADIDSPVAGC